MSGEWNRLNRQLERERKVRRTRIRIGIGAAVLVVLMAVVFSVARWISDSDNTISEVLLPETETELYSETDDIEETESGSRAGSTQTAETEMVSVDYDELSAQIEEILSDESISGDWSVYLKNLDTSESLLINDESMYAASLIKLFVMQSCYEYLDDLVANYCSIHNTNEDAALSTIKDRIYTMIVYSRNESYNELVRLHSSTGSFTSGCRLVNSFIVECGYSATGIYSTLHPSDSSYETTGEGINHTTTKDCGDLLEAIYYRTCVSEEASEEMLSYLLQQETTTKIPAGIPDGISVANKTGETDEESHDAAIVFGEKTDYILCVMSTGVDVMGAGNAGNIIKSISALVYEFLN
ncbi:MAG: class A beta-lactamase-related serine hydrolase [Lachnospiraceae bacterium]|nr:class A beta-lactamase-related serine hydrolase [Lachnospiraceae bacterium]